MSMVVFGRQCRHTRSRGHRNRPDNVENIAAADVRLVMFLRFCFTLSAMTLFLACFVSNLHVEFFYLIDNVFDVRQPSAVIVSVGFLSALLTNGAASVMKRFFNPKPGSIDSAPKSSDRHPSLSLLLRE